jgi:hypothetical protein
LYEGSRGAVHKSLFETREKETVVVVCKCAGGEERRVRKKGESAKVVCSNRKSLQAERVRDRHKVRKGAGGEKKGEGKCTSRGKSISS